MIRRRGIQPDPSQRLRAVLVLSPSPDALPDLMHALDDPSPQIVRAALARLPECAGPVETTALRNRLVQVDLAVVREWAAALRLLGDDAAVDVALRGLQAPAVGQRMAAATALGVFAEPRSEGELIAALVDPVSGVRRSALEALARFKPDDAAVEPCARCLRDSSPDVRVAAVTAIGRLASDPDHWLRRAVDDESPRVRRPLAAQAAYLSFATATALLNDPSEDVRVAATSSLIATSRPELGDALEERLADDRWRVRRVACHALGTALGRASASRLTWVLCDPHPTVRLAALNALEQVCRDDLGRFLSAAFVGAPDRLRRALIYALERCPDDVAVPLLRNAASDADAGVRLAAVRQLGGRDPAGSAPALNPLRADPDPAVRFAAEQALSRPPGVSS